MTLQGCGMRKVWLLWKWVCGKKTYLRYGVNGGGVTTWCLHRGEIACFETKERAMMIKNMFDSPGDWGVESFTWEHTEGTER